MPDNPLILFADPTPVNKARRYGGPSDFYYPSHQRQVERLAPKFNALKQAIDKGRVKIAQNSDGVPLEYTLVLEVAGDPSGFETAVRHLKGNTDDIEWLFEVVDDNVPNVDDFYRTKNGDRDDTKKMSFKYFCVVANQRVLDEILSLWQNYQQDENCTFPLGQAGLRNVFKTLRDIHLWGVAERLEETGILDVWAEQLSDPDEVDVKCEIELFFRQSPVKRIQTQNQLAQYIENIGGSVITSSCIEAIGYHAILASIPRQYAEQIIRKEYVELVQFDSIMFLKPSGQTIVLGTDDGLQFEKAFSAPKDIIDEPIVALFDGLPQERHPLLDGFLLIDDPDDFTSAYQIDDRQHGTSMASLIARGDLSDELASVTTHKIYVRPIMKPYPAYDGTQEFIPDNILIVDKIHEAVRRLYESEAGKVAASIRVINLSIGIGERMYYNMISPLAKLLDWLSFKYRVLFVVSAGNHSDDIDLGLTFDEYKALSIEQRDSRMIQILNRDSRNLRLLSPAESMNAITVGALFSDNCIWTENVRQLLPASNTLPMVCCYQTKWLDIWLEDYAKLSIRPSSHKAYRGFIENHIKPAVGNIPLEKLTSMDLQKLYKHLLESGRVDRIEARSKPNGLSVKTVRNINQMISSACNCAVEQRIIATNPTKGCALPKLEKKEMKILPLDCLNTFFEEARRSGVFELYYIDLSTGLRRGELLGLKWSDIDLNKEVIRVQRQILRQNGAVVEAPLKTKNSYRNIAIGTDTVELLRQMKRRSTSEYVFPSPTGGPISPDSVLHMLQRVLKRAGLEKIPFHSLRHTFSVLALQNGVDIKTLSSMLGHYSAGFTLDTHAHVTTAMQTKAANTVSNFLSGAIQ